MSKQLVDQVRRTVPKQPRIDTHIDDDAAAVYLVFFPGKQGVVKLYTETPEDAHTLVDILSRGAAVGQIS